MWRWCRLGRGFGILSPPFSRFGRTAASAISRTAATGSPTGLEMAKRRSKTRRMVATGRHPGGPRTHGSCALGERIEHLAAARGLSLPEIAEQAGISRAGMNDIRRGRFRPRLDTLDRIAGVLRVEAAALLSGT